jgi:iron complex outermembrane receptor protein
LSAAPETFAQSPAGRDSVQKIDAVITLGTRRHDRSSVTSAVPVDVVSAESMRTSGLIETWQILQRRIPSINAPHIPLGDDNLRPLTLRGLAPDQVLVLINGKRRHNAAVVLSNPVLNGSTPVDVGAIPAGAIERMEVLRDGAAAQYGSDAIAGVINIVLKSGRRSDARIAYSEVNSSEGGREFHDGALLAATATQGFLSQRGSSLTVTAEYRDRGRTNRAFPDERPQYLAGDPREANPPVISSHQGDGAARDAGLFLNASMPVRQSAELYAFGGLNERHGRSFSLFRRALQPSTVRSIHPDGFLPLVRSKVLDWSMVTGLRGEMSGWRWDLSSGLGRNSVRSSVHNSNNVSLGNSSPTDFYVGLTRFLQSTSNVELNRRFTASFADALSLAAGAEFRWEQYEILQGQPDSYRDGGVRILDGPGAGRLAPVGSQGSTGYRPIDEVNADRSNVAGFVDLEADISRKLHLALAGRVERYSDFGSTSDGRAAIRYEPTRGISIRSALGTGFRAPSLTQSYHSATTGVFRIMNGVNTPRTVWTLPTNGLAAQVLGAFPLRPETSTGWSGGLVFAVPRLPTVTADYYAVNVDDRIVLSGVFDDPAVSRLFEENGLRGIDAGRYFTNAIDTRTRGLDVVASYEAIAVSAIVRLTGGLNRTKTKVTRVSPTPPALSAFQSVLFSRLERGKIEKGQPERTMFLTVDAQKGRLAINLHNQRFGKASLLDASNPANDQTVSAKWITDLGVTWELTRSLKVSGGSHNIFDIYPDEWFDFDRGIEGVLSVGGIFRYPGAISPFGMNGRTIYLHITYSRRK